MQLQTKHHHRSTAERATATVWILNVPKEPHVDLVPRVAWGKVVKPLRGVVWWEVLGFGGVSLEETVGS